MFAGSLGTISTAADWRDAISLADQETGDPLDLTGCSITFNVRESETYPDDYGWRGPPNSTNAVLSGSTSGGQITITDLGVFQWAFPAPLNLCPGEHDVGIVISRSGETIQLFLGTIIVERGF